MIIDAALFLAIILGVQLVKNKFPNFLFFPKGAVLFLPPDDLPEPQPKRKADRPQGQVSVIRIQYANVKDYPFADELSRVVMTCFSLLVFVVLRVVLNLFFNYESLIAFYLLMVVIAYTIRLGISTFLLTNYSRKGCLLVAFGVNSFYLLLFLLLENYEGVYDQDIKQVAHDYVKHLEIIFNRKLDFITYRSLLGLVFLINFFIIIAIIPAVIKFGNWYTKTLKEVYHEEDADDEQAMARRVDRQETDQ